MVSLLHSFFSVFVFRGACGFDHTNALQFDVNSSAGGTPHELPHWTGLLPLSMCELPPCQKSVEYLFQEQRVSLHPILKEVIDGPATLIPRRDTVLNTDDPKYNLKMFAGIRLTRQFFTTRAGQSIFYQVIEPTQRPIACVLVMLAGTEISSDTYLLIMQSFALHQGILTVSIDWKWTGRSSGLYYYSEDMPSECADILEMLEQILPQWMSKGDRPLKVFIRGDGIGSARALFLASRKPQLFSWAGVTVGGFSSKLSSDFLTVPTWLAKLFSQIGYTVHPLWPLAPTETVGEMALRNYHELHDFFEHITSFSLRSMRSGTLYDYLIGGEGNLERAQSALDIPVLFIIAGDDTIAPVESSKDFFDGIPSKDKEFFVIDGAMHGEAIFYALDEHFTSFAEHYEGQTAETAFDFNLTPEQVEIARQSEAKFYEWIARLA